MSILSMLRRKQSMEVATAIPAIPATHGQELAGTVARIATVAVANPAGAKSGNWNSSKNSNNSSSKPCEQGSACRFWLLHFADRNTMEVAFSSAVGHEEVLASYPSALAAEPAVEIRQPDALTGSQESSIRARLTQIDETDVDVVCEVLVQCRHDEDAREYFLGRAGEWVTDDDPDDRRRCIECGNLRGGVCIVASPGGLVSAVRGYRPALPEMLQRCHGFAERETQCSGIAD